MHLAMVPSTQRDCELIADLATERPGLGKAQMMRVRRAATADKARLLGDMADMLAIANTARFSQQQCAFVDAFWLRSPFLWLNGFGLMRFCCLLSLF